MEYETKKADAEFHVKQDLERINKDAKYHADKKSKLFSDLARIDQ